MKIENMKRSAGFIKKCAGILFAGMFLLLLLSGCSAEKQPQITVVLDWTPNTNHTGLYVAQSLGYFEDRGLNVKIIEPGDNYATQLVASGMAEFGISYQEEVTFARAAGVPVVSIAALLPHNTSCFAAPASSGIKSVADFGGKKYGGWGGDVEQAILDYLLGKAGVKDKVQVINIGSTDFFAATASKSIDFSWIFYGWTGIEAEVRNEPLNVIYLTDLDSALDYYTPVLISSESFLAENPELASSFLSAVKDGYFYASENPQQAAEILLAAVPGLSRPLVEKSQEWMSGRYAEGSFDNWGYQQKSVWENYTNWLVSNGLLDEAIDVEKAFTTQYLSK